MRHAFSWHCHVWLVHKQLAVVECLTSKHYGTILMLLSAALQVSYMILQRVSPVTHSIGNCLKRVIVIVASVLFFQNPMGRQNIIGAKSSSTCCSLKHTHDSDTRSTGQISEEEKRCALV